MKIKDGLICLEQYVVWILFNIFLSLLPIGIIWFIGKVNNDLNVVAVFSSVLAFVYTLLIVNIVPAINLRYYIGKALLYTFSIVFAIIILVFFVLYDIMPKLQTYMNEHTSYWFFLIIPLLLSIVLNSQTITKRIEDAKAAVFNNRFTKSEDKTTQIVNEMNKEKTK